MKADDLRTARKTLGLTQKGLAEALRMGKWGWQTISKWEGGEVPIPGPAQVAIECLMWQPIETAPRRVEFRCLLAHEYSVVTGYWDGTGWRNERSRTASHFLPTHWKPLPMPPERTSNGKTERKTALK